MKTSSPVQELRRYPGFGTITCLCLFLLYAPIVVVAIYSFNAARSITVWGGFSLHWYARVMDNPGIRQATLNSITIALTAATIGTLIATLAAVGLQRGRDALPAQRFIGTMIRFPLLVPEIVTGISSLIFFISIGLPIGFPATISAHSAFCIPFAFLPISARLAGIDQTLDEAGRDLYASRADVVRFILLPLMLPGMLSGFCLAFIVSLDDFIIANFLTGPSSATLPVVIYGMARTGFTPEINAVATILLAASVGLLSLSLLLSFRSKNSSIV